MGDKLTRESVIETVKKGESLEGADLRGLNLSRADLTGGNFTGANFRYVNLEGAILKGAILKGAGLRHAVLRGANLSSADFTGADMKNADLRGAIVANTVLDREGCKEAVGVSEKVFFTQTMLDALNEGSKIEVNGNFIKILTGDNPEFSVTPAYRFLKLETEGRDEKCILGKVVTEAEGKELGFEIYRDSAIFGEAVYKVEPGFVGVPMRGTREEDAKKPEAEKKVTAEKIASDAELLSSYLLDNFK